MKQKFLMLVIIITSYLSTRSQDPKFTQFYHSPLYVNPGFLGTGKHEFRAMLSSRLQFHNLQPPMQSYSLSADYNVGDPRMSFGAMINVFNEGYLQTKQAYGLFAIDMGSSGEESRTWFVNVGFQGGLGMRNANRSKLLFPDQIDEFGPTGQPSQFEGFNFANKTYFDMSVGAVASFQNFMFGGAWHHITAPQIGLTGSNEESRLPHRYTFHISYINKRHDDETEEKVLYKPTIIYDMQGVSNSVLAGMLIEIPWQKYGFSIWYRGNLGSKRDLGITESHTLSLGVTYKFGPQKNSYNVDAGMRFNAGANYEFNAVHPGHRYTGGSMEMGMLYENNFSGSSYCRSVDAMSRFPWMFLN